MKLPIPNLPFLALNPPPSLSGWVLLFIFSIGTSYLFSRICKKFESKSPSLAGLVIVKWSCGIGRSSLSYRTGKLQLEGLVMNESYELPHLGDSIVIKNLSNGKLVRGIIEFCDPQNSKYLVAPFQK